MEKLREKKKGKGKKEKRKERKKTKGERERKTERLRTEAAKEEREEVRRRTPPPITVAAIMSRQSPAPSPTPFFHW